MAIWQYDIFIIPNNKKELIKKKTTREEKLILFDDSVFWKDTKISIDDFQSVKLMLKQGKSWSKELIVYGELEDNCLKIFLNNHSICSVTIRLDFRTDYIEFLEAVIDICKKHDLIMINASMSVLPRESKKIKQLVNQSEGKKKYIHLASHQLHELR